MTPADVPRRVTLATIDVAFISLRHILPALPPLLEVGADVVALVKPQFEAGRGEVGKGGVVRDPAIHQRVCDEAAAWVASKGWTVLGIETSPITGPEGNVEFLLGAIKGESSAG
jgi:23S rRNA (cytidine1920-2'-O)/16S rRNA (cytidine1409-2'-O)-methyltransferase